MTPGDEDPSCVAKLGDPMESEKLLLDSRHYNQLLGVEGAVWDQIDLDDNNPSGFINPTYVSHTLYLMFHFRWYLHVFNFITMLLFILSGNTMLVVYVDGLSRHVVTQLELKITGSLLSSSKK